MPIHVTRAEVLDGDILRVYGWSDEVTDDKGRPMPLQADGHQSAVANYVPPGPDGQPKAGAKPAQASPSEARAYCEQVLGEAFAGPGGPQVLDLGQ